METVLLIDGENFKNKIKSVFKDAGIANPAWHTYDFKGLFDKALAGADIQRSIFYFARIKEDPQTREKSKMLIEEQRRLKTHLENYGFEVVISGRVRGHMENGFGGKQILVFKEKGVDVKIAVDMVSWSCDGNLKEIILGSSDSDLQPAVDEVKKRGVSCVYLGFETQPNRGLSYNTHRTILIRNLEVLSCVKVK